MKNASDAFKSTVAALGWEQLVHQPSCFYDNVVKEFYAGIKKNVEGELLFFSDVRGVCVKFDSMAINACFGLNYHGLVFDKNFKKWSKKEMEAVKKAIAIPGAPWEPCSTNEFKIKRSSLNHEAMVWFNFVKHSLLPTSHTTNVEKERLMLLDAILRAKDVDVGRLISREIMVCHGKKAGYLFFPCLITTLCINVGVEIKGEKKSFPMDAFPTILKVKKPAATTTDASMLQQFMLQHRAMWAFQRKQHIWLASILSMILKELANMEIPVFPDWVVDEEAIDDVLFEDELNEDEEEEEVVIEKKRKRSAEKELRKETRKEVKRGKKPMGVEEETDQAEEEDLLDISSGSESLCEGEKQENIEVMKEPGKENDEEDPTSSNDEGEDFHDANDDLNVESDSMPPTTEPAKEATPENPPQENQTVEPPVNADTNVAATSSVDAAAVDKVFSPARRMRTKHVAKKRKMLRVVEEEELDVKGVTADEDASLKVVVDAVMQDVDHAAATEAAKKEAARKADQMQDVE